MEKLKQVSMNTWFKIFLSIISLGIFGAVVAIASYQGEMHSSQDAADVSLGEYGSISKNRLTNFSKISEEEKTYQAEIWTNKTDDMGNRIYDYRTAYVYMDYFSFNAGNQKFVIYSKIDTKGYSYSGTTGNYKSDLKQEIQEIIDSLKNTYMKGQEVDKNHIRMIVKNETAKSTAEQATGFIRL